MYVRHVHKEKSLRLPQGIGNFFTHNFEMQKIKNHTLQSHSTLTDKVDTAYKSLTL